MEEDIRPQTERDKKILSELRIAHKLRREEGCKLLDCNVLNNNVNLRIEIIDLKRKIRELEKERDGIYADYQDLGKEKLQLEEKCEELEKQIEFMKKAHTKALEWDIGIIDELKGDYVLHKKMIELMAEYISNTDIDEDVCRKVGQNLFCDDYGEESRCRECVIDYFRKKAR